MIYLTKFELILHFFIYLSFLLYGCYNLNSVRNEILEISLIKFGDGWDFIGQPYDLTSVEFEFLKEYLKRNFIWYLLHILATEAIKCYNSKFIPAIHLLVGVLFVTQSYPLKFQIIILIQLISFYALRNIPSKLLTWILGIVWIVFINKIKPSGNVVNNFDDYLKTLELVILLSWNVLRALSFILDRHNEIKKANIPIKRWSMQDFIRYSGYLFYFPTYVYGPLIIYERYSKLLEDDFREKDILERVTGLIFGILKVGFWIFVVNLSLHYFYIYYLEFDHDAVKLLSFLGLYGFGYMMGLFFHVQYVISYGLGITFLKYDGIPAPKQPICIARVHFYSNMWRHFDEGLYEFLVKYIYLEIVGKSLSELRKIFASFATFVFIFLWHGLALYVCVWSALNFVCITIEKLFKTFWKSKFWRQNVLSQLSINNQRRLFGLFGCHLYIPSVLSNFYFFAGFDTGNYFVKTTYTSGLGHYLILAAVCYCIFQASEWISQVTEFKKRNEEKTVKKSISLL